jgi:hypothetical protein
VRDLAAPDEYGMGAYSCAADHSLLVPADDAPGVMRCPTCGHRTDTPGTGVLADGFDIVHRQWGLRGDPHAWRAMRELLAAEPTPDDRDAVRAAYVAALVQVADVDIDHTDAESVHRSHLDHGGMSGGSIHVGWWRSKGVPLLVDRAVDRRPPPADTGSTPVASGRDAPRQTTGRSRLKDVLVSVAVWGVILAITAATIGGGAFLLVQRAVGTRVEATVISCERSGGRAGGVSTYREACLAEWTIDGAKVVGPLSAGDGGWDPGDVVDATVRGDTAYGRSLGLPILLLALGSPFLLLIGVNVRHSVRRRGSGPPSANGA